MTVRNAIEILSDAYLEAKRPFLYLALDEAQQQFCRDSKILRRWGSLQSISSKSKWNLPSNLIEIYDVRMYDSDNIPLYMGNFNISYEITETQIVFLSSPPSNSIADGIDKILIHYSYIPNTLMVVADWSNDEKLNEELEAPDGYHNGIIALAMSTLHSKFGRIERILPDKSIISNIDWQGVRQFKNDYNQELLRAKRSINSGKDGTGINVRKYDSAARVELAIPYDSIDSPYTIT